MYATVMNIKSGRKGIFPEPEHDPVIQIANYVTVQGLYIYIYIYIINL